MIDEDDDINVFEKKQAEGIEVIDKKYVIAPDAPVLPTLASQCECELLVKEDGSTMVLYTKPLIEEIEWVDYDIDLSMLTFVTWSGKVMGLGMKIHRPFRRYLRLGKEVVFVHMENGETPKSLYPAKMVIRNIGI